LTAANNLPVDTPPFPLNTTFKYNSSILFQNIDELNTVYAKVIDILVSIKSALSEI